MRNKYDIFVFFVWLCYIIIQRFKGIVNYERRARFMFNDVFLINQKLMQIDFESMSLDDKKKTLNSELIKYLKDKIDKNVKKQRKKSIYSDNASIYELMEIIGGIIPYEERSNIGKLIQYILSVASEIQGVTITWRVEDRDDLRDCPEVSFNRNRMWDSVVSYDGDDVVKVFYFVYEMFMDNFTVKPRIEERNEVSSDILRLLFKRR